MAYEFKKLSDVEVVAEPIEAANVLIEENGVIKKAPKTAVGGGASGGGMFLIKGVPGDGTTIPMTSYKRMVIDKTYEEIKEAYESGQLIVLSFDQGEWYSEEFFYLSQRTDSGFFNFKRVDMNGEDLIYYEFTIQDNGDYGYVSPSN